MRYIWHIHWKDGETATEFIERAKKKKRELQEKAETQVYFTYNHIFKAIHFWETEEVYCDYCPPNKKKKE